MIFTRWFLLIPLFFSSCCVQRNNFIEPEVSVDKTFSKDCSQKTEAFVGIFKHSTRERLGALNWERVGTKLTGTLRDRGFQIITRTEEELNKILELASKDTKDIFSEKAGSKLGKLLGVDYIILGKTQGR